MAFMSKSPIVLIIRDGWGINPGGRDKATENGDATMLAKTPFHDHLYATYPRATLSASGMDVGLPDRTGGQVGASTSAPAIVYQDPRASTVIADGQLKANKVLQEAFSKARGHRVHFSTRV
jgi:2,3-bisphosphoglycerate-independent phosphoglycerate mutase